jgi:hypothetical protein
LRDFLGREARAAAAAMFGLLAAVATSADG